MTDRDFTAAVRALREMATSAANNGEQHCAYWFNEAARYLEFLATETEEQRAERELGEWLAAAPHRTHALDEEVLDDDGEEKFMVMLFPDSKGRRPFEGLGPTKAQAILAALTKARSNV